MIQNTRNSYGSIAKSFHWTMAVLIIGMFIIANIMYLCHPPNKNGNFMTCINRRDS
jgi:cytochrome b561